MQNQSGNDKREDAIGRPIPFDDAIRILVNTPPKPKKADKAEEKKESDQAD